MRLIMSFNDTHTHTCKQMHALQRKVVIVYKYVFQSHTNICGNKLLTLFDYTKFKIVIIQGLTGKIPFYPVNKKRDSSCNIYFCAHYD